MTDKKDILSIIDYKAIIRGEIADMIYHNPDEFEIAEFEQYIADYIWDCINAGKQPTLATVQEAMRDCLHDQFKECGECGEYYRFDEMNDETGNVYCINCKPYYDPDFEWKQAKEDELRKLLDS